MEDERLFLQESEAIALLGIGKTLFLSLAKNGGIPSALIGQKKWYLADGLREYARRVVAETQKTEDAPWDRFFAAWHDTYGDTFKTAAEVAADIRATYDSDIRRTLPIQLGVELPNTRSIFEKRLGMALAARLPHRDGDPFSLERKQDRHYKIWRWRVLPA